LTCLVELALFISNITYKSQWLFNEWAIKPFDSYRIIANEIVLQRQITKHILELPLLIMKIEGLFIDVARKHVKSGNPNVYKPLTRAQ
jgi:hypothetical protein